MRDSHFSSPAPKPLTRRQFLARNMALLATAYLGGELGERNLIETTVHRVPVKNLKEPMRVTQVSDLHRSWCVSEHFVARCVDFALQTRPDAYLLTGDFVTSQADYSESCASQLLRLKAPMGQYAILGNHDWGCNKGSGGPEVAYNIAQADVRVLTNRSFVLDNGLQIVGVDDASTGHPDPDTAFAKIEWNRPCDRHDAQSRSVQDDVPLSLPDAGGAYARRTDQHSGIDAAIYANAEDPPQYPCPL